MSGVYDGLTVVELADRRNQWAGNLMADGGARVNDHRGAAHPSPIIEGPQTEFTSGRAPAPCTAMVTPMARKPYYSTPYFTILHHGKLAISLNTRHPQGLDLATRLIGISDAVVENFSGEVFPNWGLTWERIHAPARFWP